MKKVNQSQFKKDVLKILKKHGPMWLSDLHRVHGLPYATLHGTKANPASEALRNMIKLGMIIELRPRYYKAKDNQKARCKLSLPNKSNPRRYWELELIERIEEIEEQVKELKKPWYKRLFN
jgi:hypothetical protein